VYAAIPADSQTAISLRIYKPALIGIRLFTVNLASVPTDNTYWCTHTMYINRLEYCYRLISITVHAITDYKVLPIDPHQIDVFTYPQTYLRCEVKTGNLHYARQSNTLLCLA